MRNKKGFTLIELMVTIMLISILAAIATPMVGSHVNRAYATEGEAVCAAILTAQRLYFVENNKYAGTLALLGLTEAGLGGKYYGGAGKITITVSGDNNELFDVTVSGVTGGPAGGETVTIDEAGVIDKSYDDA